MVDYSTAIDIYSRYEASPATLQWGWSPCLPCCNGSSISQDPCHMGLGTFRPVINWLLSVSIAGNASGLTKWWLFLPTKYLPFLFPWTKMLCCDLCRNALEAISMECKRWFKMLFLSKSNFAVINPMNSTSVGHIHSSRMVHPTYYKARQVWDFSRFWQSLLQYSFGVTVTFASGMHHKASGASTVCIKWAATVWCMILIGCAHPQH